MMVPEQIFYTVGIHAETAVHFFHLVCGTFIRNFVKRFTAAGKTSHQKGNGSCRRDGKERAVPQTISLDIFIKTAVQLFYHLYNRRFLRRFPAVLSKSTFHLCPVTGRAECRKEHDLHHIFHKCACFPASVSQLHRHKRIGHAEESQPQRAPVINAGSVFIQRLRFITVRDDLVKSNNAVINRLLEFFLIQRRCIAEFIINHVVQIDAAQVARIVRVAAELAAGIRDFNLILIISCKQMVIIQPIRKKRPRIAPIPLGFAKLTEEITGTDRPFDIFTGRFYMETEGVLFIVPHSFHKFVSKKNADIHAGQLFFILLDMEEFINIRMAAVKSHHLRAAAAVLADHFACSIKNFHERNGTGGSTCHIMHTASCRTEIRNIDTDTP